MPPSLVKPAIDAAVEAGKLQTADGGRISAGIWVLVVLASIAVGAIVRALPTFTRWKEIGVGQRNADFDRLYERVTELEEKVDKADERARLADERARIAEQASNEMQRRAAEHVHQNDMRLMSAVSAYQLVVGELIARDPENKVLKQAQALMATAVMGDFGVGDGIRKLSMMPGVGEHDTGAAE